MLCIHAKHPFRAALRAAWIVTAFLVTKPSCAAPPPAPIVLPNGLRLVMREKHTSPLIAIDLWVRAGAREERPDEDGSAHFLEHTLFKGTTTRAPGETDVAIENLGGSLNAATGPDYAHFYTTVIAARLPEALRILRDVVRNATLPDAEVDRERGVILDELAEHDADVKAHLIDLLYANTFIRHPYRRSPGGTASGIRLRGRDTLMAFYRRTYAPERCTLALAGDLTPAKAREAAESAFGDWTRESEGASIAPPGGAYTELETLTAHAVASASPDARAWVGIALPGPAAGDKSMACAAQVTAALLGAEGESRGRLSDPVFSGCDTGVRYTPRRDGSLFLMTAGTPRGPRTLSVAALEQAMLRAVDALRTSPPSGSELEAARRQVLGHARYDIETNAGMAKALGYADLVGGDPPEAFRDRVEGLTAADIARFVQTFLDTRRLVVVRLTPSGAGSAEGP